MTLCPSQCFNFDVIDSSKHTIPFTFWHHEHLTAEHIRYIKNTKRLISANTIIVTTSLFCYSYETFNNIVHMSKVAQLGAGRSNGERLTIPIHLGKNLDQRTIRASHLSGTIHIIKIHNGIFDSKPSAIIFYKFSVGRFYPCVRTLIATITAFFLRNLQPPEQVVNAINGKIAQEQQIQTEKHRVEVARLQSEQQRLLNQTLTAEALMKQYLEVLHDMKTSNNLVVLVPTEGGVPLLDLAALRRNLKAAGQQ